MLDDTVELYDESKLKLYSASCFARQENGDFRLFACNVKAYDDEQAKRLAKIVLMERYPGYVEYLVTIEEAPENWYELKPEAY